MWPGRDLVRDEAGVREELVLAEIADRPRRLRGPYVMKEPWQEERPISRDSDLVDSPGVDGAEDSGGNALAEEQVVAADERGEVFPQSARVELIETCFVRVGADA